VSAGCSGALRGSGFPLFPAADAVVNCAFCRRTKYAQHIGASGRAGLMTAEEKAFGAFDDPAGYCGKAISPGHLREMLLAHKPLMVRLSRHTARDL
jgi:hypothetical protein